MSALERKRRVTATAKKPTKPGLILPGTEAWREATAAPLPPAGSKAATEASRTAGRGYARAKAAALAEPPKDPVPPPPKVRELVATSGGRVGDVVNGDRVFAIGEDGSVWLLGRIGEWPKETWRWERMPPLAEPEKVETKKPRPKRT